MKPAILLVLALAVLLCTFGQAHASIIAYDNGAPAPPAGIQNWQGNLGLDFTVNKTISISALGAFDDGNPAHLVGTRGAGVVVGIFNLATSSLVGPTVLLTPTGFSSQINGDAFAAVTPFLLAPGNYSVVTLNDPNYNSGLSGGPTPVTLNDGGGSINFNVPTALSRYDAHLTFDLPGIVSNFTPVPRFAAGTFEFDTVQTPEPTSLVLLCSSLIVGGFGCYRRRHVAAAS
jgi:hypothetical protein